MEKKSSFFNLSDYDFMIKGPSTNNIIFIIITLSILMFIIFFTDLGNSPILIEYENSDNNYNYIGLFIALLIIAFLILSIKYYYDSLGKIKKRAKGCKKKKSRSRRRSRSRSQSQSRSQSRSRSRSRSRSQSRSRSRSRNLKKGEVFNIPKNIYTYKQAKEVCKSYGSRLANYAEVEKAYNSGADWCNYGWSSEQQILFPTQKTTYDKLQKIKGHAHDCGRQGVNGGYMEDPELQFGVNCFGNKPKIRLREERLMKNANPYPIKKKEKKFNNDVEKLRKQLDDIIISPFNYKKWSRF